MLQRISLFSLYLLAFLQISQAQTLNKSTIGQGIRFTPKDSSFSIQWNTRFQTQYIGTQNLANSAYIDEFTVRRFRLKFKGFLVNPNIQYKIELALSNQDQSNFLEQNNEAASIILDAVLKWNFHKNWQLWVGQTKLPGNRERVISSGALQLVERSILNSRYNIDRDMGIQLRHYHYIGKMVVREQMAFSMGEGRNITTSNAGGYDYTGRIELLPLGIFKSNGDYFGADLMREPTPKISLGITYDYNIDTQRQGGQLGSFIFDEDGNSLGSNLNTFFFDAYFKYKGWSLMYEFVDKQISKGAITGFEAEGSKAILFYTGHAHNIQGGYLFKNNFAIDARFTSNTPDTNVTIDDIGTKLDIDDPEKRYEIGISKYIEGHTLKIQASAAYRDRLTEDDEMVYYAQLEIGF